MRDGRIVEVMEVVGVEGSRVLFERYLPLHDTVLKTVSCSVGSHWVITLDSTSVITHPPPWCDM